MTQIPSGDDSKKNEGEYECAFSSTPLMMRQCAAPVEMTVFIVGLEDSSDGSRYFRRGMTPGGDLRN
jgi:hypothetical protein